MKHSYIINTIIFVTLMYIICRASHKSEILCWQIIPSCRKEIVFLLSCSSPKSSLLLGTAERRRNKKIQIGNKIFHTFDATSITIDSFLFIECLFLFFCVRWSYFNWWIKIKKWEMINNQKKKVEKLLLLAFNCWH